MFADCGGQVGVVVGGDLNVVVEVVGGGVLGVEDAAVEIGGAVDEGWLQLEVSVKAADSTGTVTALATRVAGVR